MEVADARLHPADRAGARARHGSCPCPGPSTDAGRTAQARRPNAVQALLSRLRRARPRTTTSRRRWPGRGTVQLAHAAFVNSQQQLASAELLLEHGYWPVAHALATLALEEIGKSFLCIFAS